MSGFIFRKRVQTTGFVLRSFLIPAVSPRPRLRWLQSWWNEILWRLCGY